MGEIERLLTGIAKFGRHAKLILFPNRSGVVKDGYDRVVIAFASLDDLYNKLELV
jgi:hypothetical protein